jgi:FixJ family two-component response regulator
MQHVIERGGTALWRAKRDLALRLSYELLTAREREVISLLVTGRSWQASQTRGHLLSLLVNVHGTLAP